jgi:hypothetical protein
VDHRGRVWTASQARAAGFVAGWTSHESARRLARLARQWKSFRRARPFWRR